MKKYYIPELRIEIEAKNDAEFQLKREKLLNRNTRYNTGGHKSRVAPVLIKEL